MAADIRGDGLMNCLSKLMGLEQDPKLLAKTRTRYERSPPHYESDVAGMTTQSASPEPAGEQRLVQLTLDRLASLPNKQFEAQTSAEVDRIVEESKIGIRHVPAGTNFDEMARKIVKQRWEHQGIWDEKWNDMAEGRWKHEHPAEDQSESEAAVEARTPPPLFSFSIPKKISKLKSRRSKSDGEHSTMERQVVRKREREASRPYHQFVYQISEERQRIYDEPTNADGIYTADINSKAYKHVKETWEQRGIWNRNWGILPGMSWKHEAPLQDLPEVPVSNVSNQIGDDGRVEEASAGHVSEFSSAQSNNLFISGNNGPSQPVAMLSPRLVQSPKISPPIGNRTLKSKRQQGISHSPSSVGAHGKGQQNSPPLQTPRRSGRIAAATSRPQGISKTQQSRRSIHQKV